MDDKTLVGYLDYIIGAVVGGIGSSLLTVAAMWRKFVTKGDHTTQCIETRDGVEVALEAAAELQDVKLEGLREKLDETKIDLSNKIAETKRDLSAQVEGSKKDLSGKLATVVALLTGKQIDGGH